MIILQMPRKAFLTKSNIFHVKIPEGTNLNVVKDKCDEFTINIILNGRNSKTFPGLGWRWLSSSEYLPPLPKLRFDPSANMINYNHFNCYFQRT